MMTTETATMMKTTKMMMKTMTKMMMVMMMKMMMVMMMRMMMVMMMKMMMMKMMKNHHAFTSTNLLTFISHHDFQHNIIATNSFSYRYMYILYFMIAFVNVSFCVSI